MENRIFWSLKRPGLWPQHLLIIGVTSTWDGCQPFGDSAEHSECTVTWGSVSLRLGGQGVSVLYPPCGLSPSPLFTFSAIQEVQPSLQKSIHLFWSGEGSPKSTLPGAKHLDPLLQMAQRHQPPPPDKGFLGTWSALGGQTHGGIFVDQLVTTPARTSARDADGGCLQQGLECLGWV